jgi:hypothetical protein
VRRHATASFAGSTQGSGIRRGRFGLVCLCVLGLAAFLGSGAPSAGAQACPNEALRQGPSANLPDCRAYELVSPPEKEGYEVDNILKNQVAPAPWASPDGGAVAWSTERGGFGEIPSNGATSVFLSRRGAADWGTEGISPPLGVYTFIIAALNYPGFSEDLSKMVFAGGWKPPLTPDASDGTANLYLRDNSNGSFRLLSVGAPPNEPFFEPDVPAGSADLSHVTIKTPIALTGCAPPSNLCDWSAATGALSVVGRAPVTDEVLVGAVNIAGQNYRHPVSADGSRIFFSGGGSGCGICVRINGSSTQAVASSGTFQIANTEGTVAYVIQSGDLKRYDVAADELTDLTPGGEVQGVLGASSDGSRVYFVAKAELAPGATAGENNLYLWTEGEGFEFIAKPVTLTSNWANPPSSRVTPDGMHVAFTANTKLTEYDNKGKTEAYLYSAATGELVCASCNPIAEPTTGGFIEGGGDTQMRHLSRNLSDDGGRLFFLTNEALVPRDTNNSQDVYEYDAASAVVALITPGTGGPPFEGGTPSFDDASASGNDAFFIMRQPLVGIDQDKVNDVYDARVDGGLASQNPPAEAPPCTGDACRSETAPTPTQPSGASAGFVGKGNLSQKQNCNKLGKEAKKLSNRSKQLRKNAKTAKRNGKNQLAKKRNKKANRLAKQARNKSKSAKKCRKRNRGASK